MQQTVIIVNRLPSKKAVWISMATWREVESVAIVNTIHMEITVRGVNQAIIVLLGCPRHHLMSVKVQATSG